MLIFKYFSNKNEGDIKPFMLKEEFRKKMKSNFNNSKPIKSKDFMDDSGQDSFDAIGIISFYNAKNQVDDFSIYEGNKFIYKEINLMDKVGNILPKLKAMKVEYTIDDNGLDIENGRIGIFVPDMIEDAKDPYFAEQLVKGINIAFKKGDCSLSFERLISHHIPPKKAYEKSKISAGDGPSLRIYHVLQKYFAGHGKSKVTKQYIETQKALIDDGKVMDAIKKDVEDIKMKTNTLFTKGIKQMTDYARTLDPKDFINK